MLLHGSDGYGLEASGLTNDALEAPAAPSLPLPPTATAPRLPPRATVRRTYVSADAQVKSALGAPISLDDAYQHCRHIAREVARTFYYGSLFLPPMKRRASWALYGFCRTVDDIADETDLFPDPIAELTRWRSLLVETYAGRPSGPVMSAWADMLERFPVPLAPALDLLAGVEMDTRGVSFRTFEDLRLYCYRVAGTVGLLMTPILGYRDEAALSYAVDLGIAMQLTNILRDIGEDAARGRVYLPEEDLVAFGCDRASLVRGEITPAFRNLMAFQITRAEAYYERGMCGIPLLDRDARLAIHLSGTLYRTILARIRRNGYDVFTRRAHVPFAGKLAAVPSTWLRIRLGPRSRLL
ncbi:MAG: squalene/phytoene synthase family protein [Ktedonobacterales bacterium]|nr:squalene/phytoene synthase family protein [Ktedonobacterales bacterium]